MNLGKLMYIDTAIGISCFLGVNVMQAFIDLIALGIKQLRKNGESRSNDEVFEDYYL